MQIKHLYKRTITRKGKKIKAWYFWFYDSEGNQIRRSCGTNHKPCLTKKEAEIYLASIGEVKTEKTFNYYASDFYDENSEYLRFQEARGIINKPQTLKLKRSYLQKFLSAFGNKRIDVKKIEIDTWLLNLKTSNDYKNHIIYTINQIYSYLHYKEILHDLIEIKPFSIRNRKKGILTDEEIKLLFPENEKELIRIWSKTRDKKEAYKNASAALLSYTTGMRNGEVRALIWKDFIQKNVILLNSMFDATQTRVNYLKKGDEENKKWRVLIVPKKTVDFLNTYKSLCEDVSESDLLFDFKDDPELLRRFYMALRNIDVDHKERRITFHSLRYAYNTKMKQRIDNNDLRLIMGHVTEKMTNYYDLSTAMDNLNQLIKNQDIIDSTFTW